MKRLFFVTIIGLFLIFGCGEKTDDNKEENTNDTEIQSDADAAENEHNDSDSVVAVTLSGSVEKGPFVLGSSITISPVDSEGNPTGQQFTTQTINDLGEFEVDFDASGFVSLEGSGFYFNEVDGKLSSSNLTLRAFYEIKTSGKQDAHLNLLTHLIYNRVKTLIKDGKTMDEAVAQAEGEIVEALPIGPEDFKLSGNTTNLTLQGGDTDDNAYLFAVSAVIIHTAFYVDQSGEGGVQELINKISSDLADDGELKTDLVEKLKNALSVPGYFDGDHNYLITEDIEQNLNKRFEALGSVARVPDLDKILDQDGDGIVNADDNCWTVANPEQDASACSPVITDTDTGLMWQNPTLDSPLKYTTVREMFNYCENLSLEGHDDWYVPSISELRSIIDGCPALETGGACGLTDSCINSGCYEGCSETGCAEGEGPSGGLYVKKGFRGSKFISSTFIEEPDYKDVFNTNWTFRWAVDFNSLAIGHANGEEQKVAVRCVRGGTPKNEICPEHYHYESEGCYRDSNLNVPDRSPEIKDGKVIFYYFDPPGKSLKIIGDFTTPSWDASGAVSMTMDNNSIYYFVEFADMPCGWHAYKFIIDDTWWVADPLNPDDDGESEPASTFHYDDGDCGDSGDTGEGGIVADIGEF